MRQEGRGGEGWGVEEVKNEALKGQEGEGDGMRGG